MEDFSHEKEFVVDGDLDLFIKNRLESVLESPTDNRVLQKIPSKDINLEKYIRTVKRALTISNEMKSITGLSFVILVEHITINRSSGEFKCVCKSPENINCYLEFTDCFTCKNENGKLTGKLITVGKNKLPSLVRGKITAEYMKMRYKYAEDELKAALGTMKESYDFENIIQ